MNRIHLTHDSTVKAIILTCLFLLSLAQHIHADTVKEDKARVAAQNWYRHYAPENKKSATVAKFSVYKHNERTAFYIYNFDQGGFVLVSANDAVTPVLGYGFEHSAPDEITNEAVKGWLDNYARQIDTAFVLNLKNEEMTSKWQEVLENKIPVKSGNSVGPLLTTTWDQGWPYNAMCPEDPSGPGGHTWAGCTATAMAQILKYWNSPEGGVGYHSYLPRFNPQYGTQSVFYNETDYEWAEMENTVNLDNYEAISTLQYHAGVSADMDYSSLGSGAHLYRAIYGFKRNFDFSDSIIQVYRSVHNDSSWFQIIKTNINRLRPVLMEGYNSPREYGHAWVCDGYDQNDYLHVNWGWSGSLNGYWQFNNLYPAWFDLRFHQSAITNLFPNLSNLESRFIALKTEHNYEYHFIDNSFGNPAVYYWNFGDQNSSIERNPIHAYADTGFYMVNFIVGKNGIYDTLNQMHHVTHEPFIKTNIDLLGSDSKIISVDYNTDGYQDIIINGTNGQKLYKNNMNGFHEVPLGIPFNQVSPSFIECLDVENSNWPDLFLTGQSSFNASDDYAFYFKNNNGQFSNDTLKNIPNNTDNPSSAADYNNDGKTDLLVGNKLYRNIGNKTFIFQCFIGDVNGISVWADFDLDSDLDVAIGNKIFKNQGNGLFTDIGIVFQTINHQGWGCFNLEWGDFNGDGLPDLLAGNLILINQSSSGFQEYKFQTVITPNNCQNFFSNWADIDNDGDLDVITIYLNTTRLYKNNNGILTQSYSDLKSFLNMGSCGWIDYNKDNRADLLITGYFTDDSLGHGNNWFSNIYKNNCISGNEAPTVPENTSSIVSENQVFLSWNPSTDDHTKTTSLTYNLSIGTSTNTSDIFSPLSNLNTGERFKMENGNIGSLPSWSVKNLLSGKYYWKVQSIDNSYSASAFSVIDSFYISGNNPPEFINISQNAYTNKNTQVALSNLLNSYYDPENDSLAAIRIDSVPQLGMLLYNGLLVDVGQVIPINLIGNLNFFTNSFTDDFCYISPNDGNNWGLSSKLVFNLVLFEKINLEIESTLNELAWGDYNNDGYIDFSIGTSIFRNTVGIFEDIGVVLTGEGEVSWLDFDSDGDLDLFVGEILYKNEGDDIFIQFNEFFNLSFSASKPCDFNSDNQIDYFRNGQRNDYNIKSYLYLNSALCQLTEIETNISGLNHGSISIGDVDNNGGPEIALCGVPADNESITQIYKYEDQLFSTFENQLVGVYSGDIDFGDFDKDGDPDLIFCGLQWNELSSVTWVYRNNGNTYDGWNPYFLPQVYDGIAKWVDLNSDGYLDIILGGYFQYFKGDILILKSPEIHVYLNQAGVSFIELGKLGLPDLSNINCSFSDYDNDGFIDLLLSGQTEEGRFVTNIYRNGYGSSSMTANSPPSMPTLLNHSFLNGSMNFTWSNSDDDTTPQDALSYNIYVRRNQESVYIVSPLADTNTGFRKIVNPGNASINNFYKLDSLSPGTYYWSVQAIDNSFAGGPFAPEQTFTVEDYTLKRFSAKVFLEGAFNPGSMAMNNSLLASNLIPSTQPYGTAPWNYNGEETITSMPEGVIDWVLVELRQAASAELATEATIIEGWPKALLLKSDGSIVGLDNKNPLIGETEITENLYIVVRHRNHLDVMSAAPLFLSGNTYSYDFTDDVTKAYGGAAGYKQIGTGVYGMVAGDIDADGSVFASDFNLWAINFGLTTVYLPADVDIDGQVFASDFNKWAVNFGTNMAELNLKIFKSQVP